MELISRILWGAAAVLLVLALVTWLGFHIVAAGAVALIVAAVVCAIAAWVIGYGPYHRRL